MAYPRLYQHAFSEGREGEDTEIPQPQKLPRSIGNEDHHPPGRDSDFGESFFDVVWVVLGRDEKHGVG